MWLKYGVAPDNTLRTIEDVSSGKTNLLCPFCGSGLTAKKGKIKQHHFAHLSGETCLRVKRGQIPSLPLYDNFHLQLSAKDFQLL
ncbi:MAG: competence protein CoiA family protein [Prochloraceae cyanobacterium]